MYPEGHVLYRRANHHHPVVERGEGAYLIDTVGRRYIDASGGAIVANIGHAVLEIVQKMAEQASRVAYVHATMFTSQVLEDYAQDLAEVLSIPEVHFYFLSSGSEAVETALKLARQAQVEKGHPKRYLPLSRWGSYHGTTLGALGVTGRPGMRAPFDPMLLETEYVPPPYCYRCPFNLTYPECDLRCAEALAEEIKRIGAGKVTAFIAESISGASLGAVVPPPGYWSRIRRICDDHDLLLIVDEVMCGFGRTGRWFGFQHWDITPDVVTMGKGSTGGYFPLSIVAVRDEWTDVIFDGSGEFVHGGTFSHHAVGAATGLATLRYLRDHDLISASERNGKLLGNLLRRALGDLPCIGDIRGVGLLWAIEFVADRVEKTPFPPELNFARKVADAAFQHGLLVYPSSGCVDGEAGDLIMIGPPYIVTEEQLDEIVASLGHAIAQVVDRYLR